MTEHRVPVLGGSLHRHPDPARSSDPRIRELVSALGGLQIAPPPRAHFRAELRSQLVAVTPRLVAEGPAELVRHTPETVAAAEQAQPSRLRALTARLPHLGRPVRIAVAALTVVTLALSGVVWLSRGAMPGDALYGVKRASEDAQLSLTSGNVPRGKELLSFAKTRADEVSELLSHVSASASGSGPQAGGGISDHTASLVRSTLGSADDDIRQASQLFGTQAVRDSSASPLSEMIDWAPGQMSRLGDILARIPAGSLHQRAMSSAKLVSAAFGRAQALRAELGCNCLDHAGTDSLGPLPCQVCAQSTPTTPPPAPHEKNEPGIGGSTNTHPSPTRTSTSTPGPASNGTGNTQVQGPTGNPTGSGQTGSPAAPGNPLPTLPLPTLPLPTLPLPTQPPITVDSCGAGITLGPIGIGIGPCGVHVHV